MVFTQLIKISKMIDSNELDTMFEIVGSIIENIGEALS